MAHSFSRVATVGMIVLLGGAIAVSSTTHKTPLSSTVLTYAFVE
jgi:hypothetical protein